MCSLVHHLDQLVWYKTRDIPNKVCIVVEYNLILSLVLCLLKLLAGQGFLCGVFGNFT